MAVAPKPEFAVILGQVIYDFAYFPCEGFGFVAARTPGALVIA